MFRLLSSAIERLANSSIETVATSLGAVDPAPVSMSSFNQLSYSKLHALCYLYKTWHVTPALPALSYRCIALEAKFLGLVQTQNKGH